MVAQETAPGIFAGRRPAMSYKQAVDPYERVPPVRKDLPRAAKRFSRDQLTGLPGPVVRYFELALTPGQPLVRYARLAQSGAFAMRREQWAAFTATEDFDASPPAFLWEARIRLAPFLVARVRDSYRAGEGAVHGKLAGIVTLVNLHGTPETAAASLQRYLAEAVWLPTALLPSAELRWTPVDDDAARATLTDRGLSVWVDFRFSARGEIVETSTERYRDVGGSAVRTPWIGRFWDYERLDGMMVPRQGEVAWLLPEGRFPYWRGRIEEVEYTFLTPEP
jgi:hypothetical protein